MKSAFSIGLFGLILLFFTPARAIKNLDDILVGGKYRMKLTTGDVLEGTVELKDDTSLVVEDNGTPYKFRGTLILKYEMLSPPEKYSVNPSANAGDGISESEILSYEDLQKLSGNTAKVDVTISTGTTFRGRVSEVTEETMYLDIDGSIVPITREIIKQIATVVQRPPQKADIDEKPNRPLGPLDTIYVNSNEYDEYGNPKPPLMLVGYIRKQSNGELTLETTAGDTRKFENSRVARVIRHSKSSYEDEIERYAKPLFCEDGMNLVDVPPSESDRPFFKVCIDAYEYPNTKGARPRGNVSFDEAREFCEAQGKRLCTAEEWQYACSGVEGYTYPYGWVFEEHVCNTDGAKNIEVSGHRHRCVSKYGSYDMTGNIFEWVVGENDRPMLMGGPYSKCQTVSPGVGGAAKPQTGFRCCKSN